jgi:hypothetical protein
MGETVPYHDGVELTVHADAEPGNGDPIVVVPIFHDNALGAEKLGTGFSSWEEVASQVAHAVETGERTQDIPPHVCKRLYSAQPERVHLFSLAGSVEFSIKSVEAAEE